MNRIKSQDLSPVERNVSLYPVDIQRIASLCGYHNENIKQLAKRLDVDINHRGHLFQISGAKSKSEQAEKLLLKLYSETEKGNYITKEDVHINLQESALEDLVAADDKEQHPQQHQGTQEDGGNNRNQELAIITPKQTITPKGINQKKYLSSLRDNDIQFVIGPAGTGKTYLAVAYAVQILKQKSITHICLVRPAVEAGETLGFLPGTLIDKINPYLRPLYDALYATLGYDETTDLMEKNIIEVNPLAYMRGRTLDNCIVILDEGQNTSREQMKMFLTRLGYNSKAIITGDLTQIDLPSRIPSGMIQAIDMLKDIKGIGISRLTSKDVIRHPLVTKIINAYEQFQNKTSPR